MRHGSGVESEPSSHKRAEGKLSHRAGSAVGSMPCSQPRVPYLCPSALSRRWGGALHRSLGSLCLWLSLLPQILASWSPAGSVRLFFLGSCLAASVTLPAPGGDCETHLLVSCLSATLSCAARCPMSENHSFVGFVLFFTCFKQKGKSSPCYSISARSGDFYIREKEMTMLS